MGWKQGPMPKDTYGYGGVVLPGMTSGFYFADFCGGTVKLFGDPHPEPREISGYDVAYYNNDIELPIPRAEK